MTKMAPTSTMPARWKESFKKMVPRMLPSLERVPSDPCPSGTRSKVSHGSSFSYDPCAFQAAASVLELGRSKFLCKSFQSGVLVSHSPPALPDVSPPGF